MGIAVRTVEEIFVGDGVNSAVAVPLSAVPLAATSVKVSFPVTGAGESLFMGDSDVNDETGTEVLAGKTFTLIAPKKQWFDLSKVFFFTNADLFSGTPYAISISYTAKTGR